MSTPFTTIFGTEPFAGWGPGQKPFLVVDGSYYPKVNVESILWIERINHRPDEISFRTHPGATAITEGMTVKLYWGVDTSANLKFSGTMTAVDVINRSGHEDIKGYRVECVDNTRLLNRRLVTGRWSAQRADQIFSNIGTNFTAGFTFSGVLTSSPTLDEVLFINRPVMECYTELAMMASGAAAKEWNWRLDPDDDLAFFDTRGDLPEARQLYEKQNSSGKWVVDSNSGFSELRPHQDNPQIRTRVVVEPRGSQTTAAVAAAATSIAVEDLTQFKSLLDEDPDGTGVGKARMGGDLITYTGTSASSGPGNLTTVAGVDYAHDQGEEVVPRVIRDDTTAQGDRGALEGGDGIHEFKQGMRDATVKLAIFVADAQLQQFATQCRCGTYTTNDLYAVPGVDVVLNLLNVYGEGGPPFGIGVDGADGEETDGFFADGDGTIDEIISPLKLRVTESRNTFTPKDDDFDRLSRVVTYGNQQRDLIDYLVQVG